MKNLIAAILFLVCATAHAANPSMAQLNFASNSLVAQISAAGAWTNAGDGVLRPTTNAMIGIGPDLSDQRHSRLVEINQTNEPPNIGSEFGSGMFTYDAGGGALVGRVTYPTFPIPDVEGQQWGILGAILGGGGLNSGIIGTCITGNNGSTNIGVSGVACSFGASETNVGVFAAIMLSDSKLPVFDRSVALIADNCDDITAPIIIARTNYGSFNAFAVFGDVTTNATYISSLNGFASYSTLATNAVTPTGWTNTAGVNVSGYITATAVSFTINDRSGAVLYTSPTLTATLPVFLQNGWSVQAASGLVGTILPW